MAQDDYIRTALRVPPDLHRKLHQAAEARGRSFNAEILDRLIQSFQFDDQVKSVLSDLATGPEFERDVIDTLHRLTQRVNELASAIEKRKAR